jgi:hypothetical protein
MIILDPISVANPGVFVSSNVPEDDYPAHGLGTVYAAGDRVMDPVAHINYESKQGARAVVTLTAASPAVVSWVAHGLVLDTPISFSTTGSLPTGLVAGIVYYVRAPVANSFNLAATPGGALINTPGTQSGVHTATAGQNIGQALTDTAYWLPKGATNRWRMFDTYNNTQTENPELILIEVDPKAIAQGVYIGNVEAAEIVITSTDPVSGVVYNQATSMQTSNSGSSFYRWLFGRRRRKIYFLTLDLPLYYAARVKIEIKNPGAVAKCGMCNVGPIEDVGLTQWGIGTDIKDYSTTRFNFDGTSESTERGFSKRMTLDVVLDNDMIDYVQEKLSAARQRSMVYIGIPEFGSTVLCGKYSSFKNVIPDIGYSKMALQIEGTV